jgi:hypothetical protein
MFLNIFLARLSKHFKVLFSKKTFLPEKMSFSKSTKSNFHIQDKANKNIYF